MRSWSRRLDRTFRLIKVREYESIRRIYAEDDSLLQMVMSHTLHERLAAMDIAELRRLSDILLRDLRPLERIVIVDTHGDRRFKTSWIKTCEENMNDMDDKHANYVLEQVRRS